MLFVLTEPFEIEPPRCRRFVLLVQRGDFIEQQRCTGGVGYEMVLIQEPNVSFVTRAKDGRVEATFVEGQNSLTTLFHPVSCRCSWI